MQIILSKKNTRLTMSMFISFDDDSVFFNALDVNVEMIS